MVLNTRPTGTAGAASASSLHTKYCVPSVGVAAEVEDVRVIGSDHGHGVVDAGHEARPADGSVHFHSFVQRLLGLAFVVSVIDAAACHRHDDARVSIDQAVNNLLPAFTSTSQSRGHIFLGLRRRAGIRVSGLAKLTMHPTQPGEGS